MIRPCRHRLYTRLADGWRSEDLREDSSSVCIPQAQCAIIIEACSPKTAIGFDEHAVLGAAGERLDGWLTRQRRWQDLRWCVAVGRVSQTQLAGAVTPHGPKAAVCSNHKFKDAAGENQAWRITIAKLNPSSANVGVAAIKVGIEQLQRARASLMESSLADQLRGDSGIDCVAAVDCGAARQVEERWTEEAITISQKGQA